jgi:outer membrane protein assembly factor BamD (BamD/ComL family)
LDPQESVLVHAAVRALRVDGRTSRARSLLSEYLSRFPHGALAEDAVALQIEAAVAARDSIEARRWASRYVNDFPSGRFRAVADSVLREDSSKESSGSRP